VGDFTGYWRRVAGLAQKNTDGLTWKKVIGSLMAGIARDVIAGEVGARTWHVVAQSVAIAVAVYIGLTLAEYLWHFVRAPVIFERGRGVEIKRLQPQQEYFRGELATCIERLSRPAETRQAINVPRVFKRASAEWLAQNPTIQNDLDQCRAEVDRLRKIVAGIPDG
jgi:hypothetical protein